LYILDHKMDPDDYQDADRQIQTLNELCLATGIRRLVDAAIESSDVGAVMLQASVTQYKGLQILKELTATRKQQDQIVNAIANETNALNRLKSTQARLLSTKATSVAAIASADAKISEINGFLANIDPITEKEEKTRLEASLAVENTKKLTAQSDLNILENIPAQIESRENSIKSYDASLISVKATIDKQMTEFASLNSTSPVTVPNLNSITNTGSTP